MKKQKTKYFSVIMLGLAFILMLGGEGPLYIIFTLPPFSFFRFPSRFLQLFLFGLVVLSGSGLANLLASPKLKKIYTPLAFCLIGISILNILIVWLNYHPVVPFKNYVELPEVAKFLIGEPRGKIYSYRQNVRAYHEFFKTGSERHDRYLELRNELANNLNVLYHLPSVDSYASSLTPRRLSYLNNMLGALFLDATPSAQLDRKTENLLSIRNTNHIISPLPLINDSLVLVNNISLSGFDHAEKIYVYRNKKALPTYYVVNKYQKIATLEDFTDIIHSHNFAWTDSVLVENELTGLDQNRKLIATIEPVQIEETKLSLRVSSNQPAIVATTNSYYPGWQATIDGTSTPVFPVNFINLGLAVPAGKHLVHLAYQPLSVKYGVLITVFGYLLVMSIGLYLYLKRL